MAGKSSEITPIENDNYYKNCGHRYKNTYIDVEGFRFPKPFEKLASKILDFEVYDSDIWVTSFPKAGTTWTQEMVWLIGNNLNYKKAQENLDIRFPFLEVSGVMDFQRIAEGEGAEMTPYQLDSVKLVSEAKQPRFIKTHLPWNLLPRQIQNGTKKPKLIHVVRDPKDVCVSFYHHCRILDDWTGTFEEFFELFLSDRVIFAPFWKNIASYWEHRRDLNILFLKYEDMKKDLPSAIKKVANYLDEAITDEEVKTLSEHLSFENMKKNNAVNKEVSLEKYRKLKIITQEGNFIRSGKVGDHKTHMSDDMIKKINKWTEENSKNLKPLF